MMEKPLMTKKEKLRTVKKISKDIRRKWASQFRLQCT